jgi:hypothetical protein
MIDPWHLLRHVIVPTLGYLRLDSPEARALLLRTASQESGCGQWLKQRDGGPAVGIYQMEPATHHDLLEHLNETRVYQARNLLLRAGGKYTGMTDDESMAGNLYYATAMCRLQYWRFPEPLPRVEDVEGQARYWKKYYNTIKGKGTVSEFIENAERVEDAIQLDMIPW